MEGEIRTYCSLPDNAIKDCVVEICSWLDGDTGNMMYAVRYDGNKPLTTFLGLLHMAQVTILREFESETQDDQ